jgi:hypothetical protein
MFLAERFGESSEDWVTKMGRRLPASLIRSLGRRLLNTRWFVRDVVINRWFLHADDPPLSC